MLLILIVFFESNNFFSSSFALQKPSFVIHSFYLEVFTIRNAKKVFLRKFLRIL